jgi:hypothetical protein
MVTHGRSRQNRTSISTPAAKAGGLKQWESCAKTVPKPHLFSSLGIALSEKQIPQVVENIEK